MGFAVLDGARAAEAGAGARRGGRRRARARDRPRTRSSTSTPSTTCAAAVASAPRRRMLGQALAVKPILELVDGRVAPLEKVRTGSKALARLEELVVERAAGRPCDIAVHHLDSAGARRGPRRRSSSRAWSTRACSSGEVGAVVGAHVGPGMVAVGRVAAAKAGVNDGCSDLVEPDPRAGRHGLDLDLVVRRRVRHRRDQPGVDHRADARHRPARRRLGQPRRHQRGPRVRLEGRRARRASSTSSRACCRCWP